MLLLLECDMCYSCVPSEVTVHCLEPLTAHMALKGFRRASGRACPVPLTPAVLSLAHRHCARTHWSSLWRAGTPAKPSGRHVWSTMPSSGSLKSPSQSPKPFCAAKAPASATGKFQGENQTAGARKGVGMSLSLPFMPALAESEGVIRATSPGDTPASVLLHPLMWGTSPAQGWG